MSAQKPKSLEMPREFIWSMVSELTQKKGKPAERGMVEAALKSICAQDWLELHKDGAISLIPPSERPEPTGDEEKDAADFQKWGEEYSAYMRENVWIELPKRQRNFVWATIYAPRFDEELTLGEERALDIVAGYLGKRGAFQDMKDDVEEWEDGAEDEDE